MSSTMSNNNNNNKNKKNSEQLTTKLQPQPRRHYSEQQLPASIIDENQIVQSYVPPGTVRLPDSIGSGATAAHNNDGTTAAAAAAAQHHQNKGVQWVYNPLDGSVLRDPTGLPVSVDRILATNPLRHELSTRPGPGNKKLTYLSGDGVSRTLNDVFGYDGWDLDIQHVSQDACNKDNKTGKHTLVYTARVRLTHKASGAYKEDCGVGDSTDRSFATALSHALKSSITDAMKRAARHFGDKLGNCTYPSSVMRLLCSQYMCSSFMCVCVCVCVNGTELIPLHCRSFVLLV